MLNEKVEKVAVVERFAGRAMLMIRGYTGSLRS